MGELTDEGGVAFVDLVADAQLAVLVVAHSVDLPLSSQQQRIEDPALNLPGPLSEINQHRSSYFFWSADPQFSVLIGPAREDASL